MLHFSFAVNDSSDANARDPRGRARAADRAPGDGDDLGVGPLGARSIVLSALLGTHPPALPVRALVALAELFGIRPGTTRAALSRMVATGELVADDGRYALAGRLLRRQREQDVGRAPSPEAWDGTWTTAIALDDRRPMARRRAFRDEMAAAGLAELRPDIWMRPANVPPPPTAPDVVVTVGALHDVDEPGLVARLWPLEELDARARRIADALDDRRGAIDGGDVDGLPATFTVAAAAVRFLRAEPRLPPALQPPRWAPAALRPRYDDFDDAFGRQLRAFFASLRRRVDER